MTPTARPVLGLSFNEVIGAHPGTWRTPDADLTAWRDIHTQVRYARQAEEADLDFLFLPDRVFLHPQTAGAPPLFPLDPIVQLSAIAAQTRRIGLVASLSTSFNEPYTIARQLRALDLISGGRAGWNVIPSFEPEAFANHGRPVPESREKYERLTEVVEIAEALWDSWGPDVSAPDPAAGRFLDLEQVRPVHLQGRHVGSRGPLQLPPSPQGRPVQFYPAASRAGVGPAGAHADAIVGMPATVEDAYSQRALFRRAAEQAGRDPDDVTFTSFFSVGLGTSRRAAVERRLEMDRHADPVRRLAQLSALLGTPLSEAEADTPVGPARREHLRAHPHAPHSGRAVALAREGWTPREIIAHGVLDTSPIVVGTAEDVADEMQRWLEAEATDGFILVLDRFADGLPAVQDQLAPVLRRRGLRPDGDPGATLRERLRGRGRATPGSQPDGARRPGGRCAPGPGRLRAGASGRVRRRAGTSWRGPGPSSSGEGGGPPRVRSVRERRRAVPGRCARAARTR